MKTLRLHSAIFALFHLLFIFFLIPFGLAGDLDDGIPIDDKIEDYDKIKKDRNILCLERHARTKLAIRDEKKLLETDDDASAAIQGSIIIGPGVKPGDITLIYKGNNNNVISR
jgi:hypothetical protein